MTITALQHQAGDDIRRNIKRLMAWFDYTQQDMAEKVGLSSDTLVYNRLKDDKPTRIPADELRVWAKELHVEVSVLYAESDDELIRMLSDQGFRQSG